MLSAHQNPVVICFASDRNAPNSTTAWRILNFQLSFNSAQWTMADSEISDNAEQPNNAGEPVGSTESVLDLPRHLIFHSMLSGLCPAIPLPFLDDWAMRFTRRRMVVAYLDGASLPTHREVVDFIIRGDPPPAKGCVRRIVSLPFKLIFLLILYPIKKMFRKLLVFLLVKDCVNQFSSTLHQGYLLQVALDHNRLTATDIESITPNLRCVYKAIEVTCKETDTRPVNKLLTTIIAQSRKTLFAAARPLRAVLRREYREDKQSMASDLPIADPPEFKGEEEELDNVLDELEDALEQNPSYFRRLESTFLANVDKVIQTAAADDSPASDTDDTENAEPAKEAGASPADGPPA
jgi:hypothetical protein